MRPQPIYPEGAPTGIPQESIFSPLTEPLRFFQEIRFRYTWLAGDAGKHASNFDVNDVELSATVAFPFWFSTAPFLVTPGFAVHYLEGPQTVPPENADLPPPRL